MANTKDLQIQRNDDEINEIINAVKTGYSLGLSVNANLSYHERQELNSRMSQLTDFAEFIAKLANRI